MSHSHGFSTYAFQHAAYLFYFMDLFFSPDTFDASSVIDFTRFCHGFAGNLRRNMEALNFSQPTRRQNGKAGGKGGAAMQKLSPALAAAKRLERQQAVSTAFWSWEKKKENTNLGINLFSSVQSIIGSVMEDSIIFTDMNFNEPLAKENGFWSHLSLSTKVFCNLCTIKLHPPQFHTDSDCWNCWSETEKWSILSWNSHGGNISSTLPLNRSDVLFPIN